MRLSGFTAPAIWISPRNRAISASTLISAAPPACWIFWTRNGLIAPTNWPTARRSPII